MKTSPIFGGCFFARRACRAGFRFVQGAMRVVTAFAARFDILCGSREKGRETRPLREDRGSLQGGLPIRARCHASRYRLRRSIRYIVPIEENGTGNPSPTRGSGECGGGRETRPLRGCTIMRHCIERIRRGGVSPPGLQGGLPIRARCLSDRDRPDPLGSLRCEGRDNPSVTFGDSSPTGEPLGRETRPLQG